MKVLTITFEESNGVAQFYGNLSPDEAILILFKAAKQGMFKEKEEVKVDPEDPKFS